MCEAHLRQGNKLGVVPRTVAVFYALCTAVWVVAPGPFIGFMNSLLHGLDFSPLLMAAEFS